MNVNDVNLNETSEYKKADKIKYDKKTKQLYWDIAVGLNEVDELKPSKYMKELITKEINGEIDKVQLDEAIREYYKEKENRLSTNMDEFECDMVSIRIKEMLEDPSFTFNYLTLKYIHKYLFQDVYDFAGRFRDYNITKDEPILNYASVNYANYFMLEDTLQYDFKEEASKNYAKMSKLEQLENFVKFNSSIWQVHPFGEGNTRTTAVFMQKYLISKGYKMNNELFKENSLYYRNALVRSNYENAAKDVFADFSFLTKFYENLLLNKNHSLHTKDTIAVNMFKTEE